jgi:two-component system, LytTR family, response regulator LytT
LHNINTVIMDVLIIEDEILAAERMQLLIKNYDPSINIVGLLESVEEAVEWLNTKTHPDLLLVDIQLADGHSFEIFKKVNIQKPIIFTTAFNQYALDAFQLLSIDYVLKPVTAQALSNAFGKYKSLTKNTNSTNDYGEVLQYVKEQLTAKYKTRFLGKVGQRTYFIPVQDVAYFSADNKIVHLIARDGKRYLKNATMEKLEQTLNPITFFRVNRKIIVHIDAIEQVKPYDNNRLVIVIKGISTQEEIIISREKVGDFKDWANA